MQRSFESCDKESIRRCDPARTDPEFLVLRHLYNAIQKSALALSPDSKNLIVDYGCGTRPYDHLLRNIAKQVVGADLPGNSLADVNFTPGEKLPLPDGAVDIVTSFQVLEHVAEPGEYLAEAYRLLGPDGKLLLSTHGVWPYHPHPNDYHRWTQEGLKMEIESAGFQVEKIVPVLSGFHAVIQLQLSLWRYSKYWRITICRWVIKLVALFCSFFSETIHPAPVVQNELVASVYLVSAVKLSKEKVVDT